MISIPAVRTQLLLFTLWALLPFLTKGQDQSTEPIELAPTEANFVHAMQIEKPSARQVDTLIQLSIAYSYTHQDTCLLVGDRSVAISQDHEDQRIYAKALLELGDSYRIFGELEKGKKMILEGRAIYEQLGDKGQVAYADNKLGALYQNLGIYPKAMEHYRSALTIWEALQDSSNLINPYINIALVYSYIGQPNKVVEYNQKALRMAEALGQDRPKMYILNNIGLFYKSVADQYGQKMDSLPEQQAALTDSVEKYQNKALIQYEQSLVLARKLKNKQSELRHFINIADIYNEQGRYQEALALNRQAEQLSIQVGDVILSILVQRNLAEGYRRAGQPALAIAYAKAAAKIAREKELPGYLNGANHELYLTYKQQGQYADALRYLEEILAYQKRNYDTEKNKMIVEAEEKFQAVEKEKQILEQQNEILVLETNNAEMKKQQNQLIGGGTIALILGLLGFQFNKIRRERNDKQAFAEALIFAQETERKRIARDLHDGIGQSLLLLKKQMDTSHEYTLENQEMIAETLEEVRSISQDLHPFQLEKFGLIPTLRDAIEKVGRSTHLFVTHEMDSIDGVFSQNEQIQIFRTVQEALNNIVKHSEATAAKITIRTSPSETLLQIQDNGKGFDHELAVIRSKSLGLRTMHERISSIGGKMKIQTGNPKGTLIEARIPIS